MAVPVVPSAEETAQRLHKLLNRARQLKRQSTIEPPLPYSEFQGDKGLPYHESLPKAQVYTAVEHEARSIYQQRAASTPITAPEFVEIWNLFDILSVCGDQEQCEPPLVWWLIEELLETQSIDGCRTVFDYLESRRERLMGKHFDKKNLAVLRAFNELLRRLSRAEESVFCGRVFVFLFQTFPLGARSSVNLKGDFHKENLTAYESGLPPDNDETPLDDAMEGVEASNAGHLTSELGPRSESNNASVTKTNKPLLSTESGLYPAFWTMQQAFSNPPEFFFRENRIDEFKPTLEATLEKFRQVPKVNQAAADVRRADQNSEKNESDNQFASTFNPKYLTSRELFALELSDLAFQRHILVQALILVDFLLSLTDEAKKKSGGTTNKVLQFDYVLQPEDAKWAVDMRKSITHYLTDVQLSGDQEGKYYNRMVETILSRDKNWVRWKLENCKEVRQPPVYSNRFVSAQNGARRAAKPPMIRSAPMGALDLSFLEDSECNRKDEMLNALSRSQPPAPETLVADVKNVDLDLEMAATEAERQELENSKMGKTWRALRLMSKSKLQVFDKVDDGRNLDCFLALQQGNDENGPDVEAMVGIESNVDTEVDSQVKIAPQALPNEGTSTEPTSSLGE